ncbi:MAG: hypothetical protein DMD79_02155 [Candidatus Rokuibacteriota bacterium]|nr:MAG: hypothetical protein DMD79_02155 [Candidatus Rokubacteria bacterium]
MGRAGCSGAGSWLAALAAAAVVVAAPTLGWVAPPDPIGVPGVYDGGDTDDLVLTLGRTHGVEPVRPAAPAVALTLLATIDLPVVSPAPARPGARPRPRAPPDA